MSDVSLETRVVKADAPNDDLYVGVFVINGREAYRTGPYTAAYEAQNDLADSISNAFKEVLNG